MTPSDRDDDERNGPDDERPGTRIDISLSVTDLLSDLLNEARKNANSNDRSRGAIGTRPSGRPSRASPAARRRSNGAGDDSPPADAGGDYRVDSYRDGDELTVVADLSGVELDDLTAGIDPNRGEFVVAVDGRVAGRASLPWDPVEVVDTTFNNGVLHVRLRPVDADE